MTKICSNTHENIKVLLVSLKLCLCALTAYASRVRTEPKKIIIQCLSYVGIHLVEWLQRPNINFGDHFGGKNGSKIKEEIKVCKL